VAARGWLKQRSIAANIARPSRMTPVANKSVSIGRLTTSRQWVLVVTLLVVIPSRTMALTPTEQRKQDYIDEVSKSYRATVSSNNQSASLRTFTASSHRPQSNHFSVCWDDPIPAHFPSSVGRGGSQRYNEISRRNGAHRHPLTVQLDCDD
jgi:hypothetical protein